MDTVSPTAPAGPRVRAGRGRPDCAGRRHAYRDERGFTLVEMLVVLVIISILLVLAVPSYLGFKERAARRAAAADVRSAIASLEAYFGDTGTYVGATPAGLRASYDAGLASVALSGLSASGYTVTRVVAPCTATLAGPGGAISVAC